MQIPGFGTVRPCPCPCRRTGGGGASLLMNAMRCNAMEGMLGACRAFMVVATWWLVAPWLMMTAVALLPMQCKHQAGGPSDPPHSVLKQRLLAPPLLAGGRSGQQSYRYRFTTPTLASSL
jgi:hypothetical protein